MTQMHQKNTMSDPTKNLPFWEIFLSDVHGRRVHRLIHHLCTSSSLKFHLQRQRTPQSSTLLRYQSSSLQSCLHHDRDRRDHDLLTYINRLKDNQGILY